MPSMVMWGVLCVCAVWMVLLWCCYCCYKCCSYCCSCCYLLLLWCCCSWWTFGGLSMKWPVALWLCCCLGLLWLWWRCCGWCCWCCGGVVWCFGHVSDLVKGCGGFEMESLVFIHCSVLKMGITLSILRLKLWGLFFWKACFMPYHFDVLSFCIWSVEILWNRVEWKQFSGIREFGVVILWIGL